MEVKNFLDLTQTLNDVLTAGCIDSQKIEISMLFDRQFNVPQKTEEKVQIPCFYQGPVKSSLILEYRAQKIFKNIIQTPVIQKCLKDFDLTLTVAENSEPDAYEDNARLKEKQARPTLNLGLFHPSLYPENYTDEEIDACVAYVLAHELGHTVVALHTPSLQKQEIKGGFTKKEKQNPENQKLQRAIEFICDSVGAISCLQAGYPCNKFEPIARFGRMNNPTHTSYTDMCQLNKLIKRDFEYQKINCKKKQKVY